MTTHGDRRATLVAPPAAVEVVVGDARAVVDAEDPGAYDVIVADVFDGAAMPRSVAGRCPAESSMISSLVQSPAWRRHAERSPVG